MGEVEYAARALLAADDAFSAADSAGEPRTWEELSEDAQNDYRTRAEVFLQAYAEAGREASR